jgi:hypothetical protein
MSRRVKIERCSSASIIQDIKRRFFNRKNLREAIGEVCWTLSIAVAHRLIANWEPHPYDSCAAPIASIPTMTAVLLPISPDRLASNPLTGLCA